MLKHPKSTLYSLITTASLFIMLTGCNFNNQGKADVVIDIDLTQPGKTLRSGIYGAFFKSTTHENRVNWIKAVSDTANRQGHWNLWIYPLKDSIGGFTVAKAGPGIGNLQMALDEAAFMIGMERDSEGVTMVSQAPSNGDARSPEMIVFNNGQAFGTPAYYAFRLFSENRPDRVMPTGVKMRSTDTENHNVVSYANVKQKQHSPIQPSVFTTAGIQEKSGLVILKIVNTFNLPRVCRFVLNYKQQIKYKREVTVLTSGSLMDENSFKETEKVVPMTKELNGLKNSFNYECPANSIVIIKLRYKKGINGIGNCC